MRHRSGIAEGAAVIGILLLAGFFALKLSLVDGLDSDKRIELVEIVIVGGLLVAAIVFLIYRRTTEQEREIALRVSAERQAHELAHRDALTGLANRREFERALRATRVPPPGGQLVHALLLLDLNNFKTVNDVHGHPAGDEVLVAVAGRLAAGMRTGDVLARIGGDEFAILAHDLHGQESVIGIAHRAIRSVEAPITLEMSQHRVGVAIGIALIPNDGSTAEEILRKADLALYRAKAERRSVAQFFAEGMDKEARERALLERELVRAIGTPALEPWYQPVINLESEEVVGFEALARWTHKTLGDVPPSRFIPIAEDCGLIRELGEDLLRRACKEAARWQPPVRLYFNVSPLQLRDRTLALRILSILGDTGLSPQRLGIEITESALMHDVATAGEILQKLRAAGVRVALDDFGTGYSSLYHLRNLHFDDIKIDRSFIADMSSEPQSAAIVRALTGLGGGLGVTITAEGVENWDQCRILREEGCSHAQGFLFARAIPGSETQDFIMRCLEPAEGSPAGRRKKSG